MHLQIFAGMVLQEVQEFQSVEQMEKFLLEYGEQVVDVLGAEVDRIELKIKVMFCLFVFVVFNLLYLTLNCCVCVCIQKESPEVRHVDLEIL